MLNVASKTQAKALYRRFISGGIKVYDVVKDGPEQYVIYGITNKKKLKVRLVTEKVNYVKWLEIDLPRGNDIRTWSIDIGNLGINNKEYGYIYDNPNDACLKTYLEVLSKDSIENYNNGEYLLKGNMVFFDIRTSLMILAISTLLLLVVTILNIIINI